MGDATVNGDMPPSATLDHVCSYPLISDGIKTFSSNTYGAKAIDLTNASYAKLIKPTFPYLRTPAAYAKPYLAKADQLGDSLLTKVDEKVPMVKSETAELKGTLMDYVHWPLKTAGEGKEYLTGKYSEEYKKMGGEGYVAAGKAVVTSSLVISSDALSWLSAFLSAKKGQAVDLAEEAKKTASAKADEAKEKI